MRIMTSPRRGATLRYGALAVALLLGAGQASVASPAWDPARALGGGDWAWSATQSFDLPGARVSLRHFRAALSPADAARRLAMAGGRRLTRLQWAGTTLLLSGGLEERHWLARLRPVPQGTDGLISSLEPREPAAPGFDPSRLVPPGSRQVLRVSSRGQPSPDALASFDCPGTSERVAAAVRGSLLAGQWLPADASVPGDAPPASTLTAGAGPDARSGLPVQWRHPRHGLLSVHLARRRASIAVTFWHRPQEAP